MTDKKNESSNGNISETNTITIAPISNDNDALLNVATPASSQTVEVSVSGNGNKSSTPVTSTLKPATIGAGNASPVIQSPTPMMSAAVTPTVLRAPLQPVHLQPVLQSYIAPHLVISSPASVSGTAVGSDTRPAAAVQAVNALQRSAGPRPALQAVQGQVHPFVIGQIGTCVMPGTARLAGNQTAHIIGTFPSSNQQFTASAGQLVNGGTVIGQLSAVRPLQPGIAIQSPTLLNTQPLYIRTAGPGQQHVIPVMPSSVHSVESQTVLPMKHQGNKQLKAAPFSSPGKGGQVVQRVSVTSVANLATTPLNKVAIPASTGATKPVTKLRPIKPAGSAAISATPTSSALPKTGPAVAIVQSSAEVASSYGGTPIAPAPQFKATSAVQTATKFVASGLTDRQDSGNVPIDTAAAAGKTTSGSPAAAASVPASTTPVAMATEDTAPVVSVKAGGGVADSSKQKAVVKPQPQILTHVIDGFIILEGTEPFPVQRSSLKATLANAKAAASGNQADEQLTAEAGGNGQHGTEQRTGKEDMRPLKCELCGKVDFAYRFKESKRFCSMACAKRYNMSSARKMALLHPKMPAKGARKKTADELNASRDSSTPADDLSERMSESSEMQDVVMRSGAGTPSNGVMLLPVAGGMSPAEHGSLAGSAESGLEDMDHSAQRKPVRQWTVDDVLDLIRSLPGCEMYVGEFSRQEIDGQALMLLKEDHMMRTMNIKLGPALKICAHVASLLQADS